MAENIFDQLAGERLFTPARPAGVEDPQFMPAVKPTPAAGWFEPAPPLDRIDGWCEDRPPHALTEEDGID